MCACCRCWPWSCTFASWRLARDRGMERWRGIACFTNTRDTGSRLQDQQSVIGQQQAQGVKRRNVLASTATQQVGTRAAGTCSRAASCAARSSASAMRSAALSASRVRRPAGPASASAAVWPPSTRRVATSCAWLGLVWLRVHCNPSSFTWYHTCTLRNSPARAHTCSLCSKQLQCTLSNIIDTVTM